MFSILLGIYLPGSGIVESYGDSMFNFWGPAKLFSIEVIPFYIPPSNVWFQFLHLLTNTCYFLCLYSFNTCFVEHLLGAGPVHGLKDAGGTEPQAALTEPRGHRHKTVAAGGE